MSAKNVSSENNKDVESNENEELNPVMDDVDRGSGQRQADELYERSAIDEDGNMPVTPDHYAESVSGEHEPGEEINIRYYDENVEENDEDGTAEFLEENDGDANAVVVEGNDDKKDVQNIEKNLKKGQDSIDNDGDKPSENVKFIEETGSENLKYIAENSDKADLQSEDEGFVVPDELRQETEERQQLQAVPNSQSPRNRPSLRESLISAPITDIPGSLPNSPNISSSSPPKASGLALNDAGEVDNDQQDFEKFSTSDSLTENVIADPARISANILETVIEDTGINAGYITGEANLSDPNNIVPEEHLSPTDTSSGILKAAAASESSQKRSSKASSKRAHEKPEAGEPETTVNDVDQAATLLSGSPKSAKSVASSGSKSSTGTPSGSLQRRSSKASIKRAHEKHEAGEAETTVNDLDQAATLLSGSPKSAKSAASSGSKSSAGTPSGSLQERSSKASSKRAHEKHEAGEAETTLDDADQAATLLSGSPKSAKSAALSGSKSSTGTPSGRKEAKECDVTDADCQTDMQLLENTLQLYATKFRDSYMKWKRLVEISEPKNRKASKAEGDRDPCLQYYTLKKYASRKPKPKTVDARENWNLPSHAAVYGELPNDPTHLHISHRPKYKSSTRTAKEIYRVPKAALQYEATPADERRAKPIIRQNEQNRRESEMKVSEAARNFVATQRLAHIAVAKERTDTSDLDPSKWKISEAALKHQTTDREVELSQPLERNRYKPLPEPKVPDPHKFKATARVALLAAPKRQYYPGQPSYTTKLAERKIS